MKDYLVIFREPDGRQDPHSQEEIGLHQENWTKWWERWSTSGNISFGSALTLEGCLIKGDGTEVSPHIHQVGTEIVGGFMLIKATSLDEAIDIAASCPIYEFGGYAEVRAFKK